MIKKTLFLLFLCTFIMGFSTKFRWDPVEEATGYRLFVRTEGQQYDYTNPVWDSEKHNGAKIENIEIFSEGEYLAGKQAFGLPGEKGDKLYYVVRAVKHENEKYCESEDSNEVSCYAHDRKCLIQLIFPPKSLNIMKKE